MVRIYTHVYNERSGMFWYRDFESLKQHLVTPQTSMNATLQIEAVNTIVLTPSGASSAAVIQGTG